MISPIDIYVAYDEYGYVATTPVNDAKSMHHSGPREAAEWLADVLTDASFKLKFVRKGHYQVFPK